MRFRLCYRGMARHKRMDGFIASLMDGLTFGAVCAVLSVSYAIAGGVSRTLIFANTAFYLSGAAIALGVFSGAGASGINPGETPAAVAALLCALAAAAVFAGAFGYAKRVGIRAAGSLRLMISIGALFVAAGMLQQVDQLRLPQYLLPAFAPRLSFVIPGILRVQFAAVQPAMIATGAIAIGAIHYVLEHGTFGCKRRAVEQDRCMAELLGIDAGRVISIAVLVASVAATLSGWMTTMVSGPTGLTNLLLLAICGFLAALFAGLSSVPKAAAAGFAVGFGAALWSGYPGPEYALPATFGILVFVLIFSRPAFGRPEGIGEA